MHSYAITSIHTPISSKTNLTIAKPSFPTDTPNVHISSLHFRGEQPPVLYRANGSRLVLTVLNTYRPETILEFGRHIKNIGLHDDGSNLIVHVFLDSYILYSMIYTPQNLANPAMKREDGWIAEYSAPSFQIRTPLYMHSISASNIIFSLSDGGILRLSNNGSGYNEHLFSDSSYFSSFKSILPWSGRPSNLVVSIQACVEKNILFTLSVDGKLKSWDVSKGHLISMHDASKQPLSYLLEPIPSSFLALRDHQTGLAVLTYCPGKPGIFKLFRQKGTTIEQAFEFNEQPPVDGLWLVFDLTIKEIRTDGTTVIHILWKLDNLFSLQTAVCGTQKKIVSWQNVLIADMTEVPPNFTTEALSNYIFDASRFSPATIARALQVSGTDIASLAVKAADTIEASVELQYDEETGNPLNEQYQEAIRLKYLQLAQICFDIDRMGTEALALVTSRTGESFVAHAHKVSPIRLATTLQGSILDSRSGSCSTKSQVLKAAHILEEALGADYWAMTIAAIKNEAVVARTVSADDTMFLMYERLVEGRISKTTAALIAELNLTPAGMLDALATLLTELAPRLQGHHDGALSDDGYVSAQRGNIASSMKTAAQLLILTTFMACSSDQVDSYRASILHVKILEVFRLLSLIQDTFSKSMPKLAHHENFKEGTTTVFHNLRSTVSEYVPVRDFLERTMVLLINSREADLATYFSNYTTYSSAFATYLKGRAQLLQASYTEAAETFARVSYTICNSAANNIEKYLQIKVDTSSLANYYLHIASLFTSAQRHDEALRFCTEAETCSTAADHAQVQSSLLQCALSAANWSEAYRALSSTPTPETVRQFITALCESHADQLTRFTYIGYAELVDDALQTKSFNVLDASTHPNWHKLLYHFRIRRHDHRGASAIMYHRLTLLRNRSGDELSSALEVTEHYLLIINALRCLSIDDAWIIVGALSEKGAKRQKVETVVRKVLALKEIQDEYQRELKGMDARLQQLTMVY